MYFWNDPYKNTFSFLSIVIQVVLKVHTSLQGRRNIGECVLSIYYDRYLLFSWQRKAEERTKLVPRGWATVKNKERDGGGGVYFRLSFSLQCNLPWLDDRRSLPYKWDVQDVESDQSHWVHILICPWSLKFQDWRMNRSSLRNTSIHTDLCYQPSRT